MMRFVIFAFVVCPLGGAASAEENAPETPPGELPFFDGSYDYQAPPDYYGGQYHPNLGVGVSFGPYIPLGVPYKGPYPSFPTWNPNEKFDVHETNENDSQDSKKDQ
uniref:Putative secreted protein n=1 Tax=Amblyomma triste TaxID=251400 RepID=A0A023G427_AMBTT